MNEKILQLVLAVLNSNLPEKTRDEIVRFYTLPRIVSLKGKIELDDEPDEVGAVDRPTKAEIERMNNPTKKGTDEAMGETIAAIDRREKVGK